jgi:hypothetical protein
VERVAQGPISSLAGLTGILLLIASGFLVTRRIDRLHGGERRPIGPPYLLLLVASMIVATLTVVVTFTLGAREGIFVAAVGASAAGLGFAYQRIPASLSRSRRIVILLLMALTFMAIIVYVASQVD